MSKDDYQAISFRFFLRGPTDSPEALATILIALEAHSLFAPTHHGVDEKKRHLYDRATAIELALNSTWSKKRLILWTKHTERAGPIFIEVAGSTPVRLSFSLKPSLLAKASECVARYRSLVARLRPHYAQVCPLAAWNRVEAVVPTPMVAEEESLGFGLSIAAIRRVGFSHLYPHSYLDEELGVALAPALADLGARRTTFGGWWIGGEDLPLAPGLIPEMEARLRYARVLRTHGLLGRLDVNDRYYFGPRWTPPGSWTATDPIVERDLAGPNE